MKNRNEILELKMSELQFASKRLHIHNKINHEAMTEFSKMFKDYIDSVEDPQIKHKLKKIVGLAGEDERRMTKTAKKAKQQSQYRKGKTKVKDHEPEEPPLLEKPKKEFPKEYKSLYRRIATKTHPDKIQGDKEKEGLLQEINSVVANEEYHKLLEYALRLGVTIPDDFPVDFNKINQQIFSINKKIEQISKSVAWEWYHLENDDEKRKLIKGYAKFLLENQ